MEFVTKYKIVQEQWPDYEVAKKELADYTWSGIVDFAAGPTFAYDVNNKMVTSIPSSPDGKSDLYVLKEGQMVLSDATQVKFGQVATLKLKKDFSLQDYLDKLPEDVEALIFYVSTEYGGTLFHPGMVVRVGEMKKDSKPTEKVSH